METDKKNPIQVADRIFSLIELLAANKELGLLEISKNLSLNKSTTHRILNSLICMGYVSQNTETAKYRLTYKICALSNQILQNVDIISVVHPCLVTLMENTGEIVHLVQRSGNHAVYIDKVESMSNTVRLVSQIGKQIPLYCSGVGKALLAQMNVDEVHQIFIESQIEALTPNTITDEKKLLTELQKIRTNEYALDAEENELGVSCIASSFTAFDEKARYAFSISAPTARMSRERLLQLSQYVKETRNKIESILCS